MPPLPRTDAHCHLFNIYFLVTEVGQILWDKLWGHYPHRTGALGAGERPVGKADIDSWFKKILQQIRDVSHAAFNSYEENYAMLTKAYQDVFKTDEQIVLYPLMMDIYYMFADPLSDQPTLGAVPPGGSVDDPKNVFNEYFDNLIKAVSDRYRETQVKQISSIRAFGAPLKFVDIDERLEEIRRSIVEPPPLGAKVEDGIELSKGFEKQVWELMKLRTAHPEAVFPFLAVDPRRRGIIDVVVKGKHFLPTEAPLVSKNGPFFGIKLYPRLGYTPSAMDKEMKQFLKWCRDNDIPITFHCSHGGFPPENIFKDWPYEDYGQPSNWDGILTAYPDLQIDFAHFGNAGKDWDREISKYMESKPGVYSDLACYTDRNRLEEVRSQLDAGSVTEGRMLFGSDFNVMLLTDFVTLKEYIENFKSVFTPEQLDRMMRVNPAAFLGRRRAEITTGHPAVVVSEINWKARDAFVKHVRSQNRFGWVRDLPDARDFTMDQSTIPPKKESAGVQKSVKELVSPALRQARRDLPARIDLRGWCSPVEDQGNVNSCTANAAAALVEYFELKTQRKYIDASRLFLYKVTRNLLNWQGDTGAYIRTTMEALVLFGMPPEQYMSYDPTNVDAEPTPFCYAFADNYKTASYYRYDPPGKNMDELLLDIKSALAAELPLMFGFTVYDSLGEATKNKGMIPFPGPKDQVIGGHAVAAFGYDNSIVIRNSYPGSAPTEGAILIKNSWGTEWGDEGYGWLPFEYVRRGLAVDWWSIIKQEWVDLDQFK